MHAASDEAERDAATELTNRLAARLPRAPTVAVGEEQNFIDRYIFGKMKADGVPHAGLSSDAEFMRRVYLDLWGRLPDTDPGNPVTIIDQNVEFPNRYTVQKFVADPDPNKRIKLIDHLLGLDYMELPFATGPDYKGPWLVQRPFVSKWTYFFADLFRDGFASGPAPADNRHWDARALQQCSCSRQKGFCLGPAGIGHDALEVEAG